MQGIEDCAGWPVIWGMSAQVFCNLGSRAVNQLRNAHVLVVCGVLCLGGCAVPAPMKLYPGPERSSSEVVTIVSALPHELAVRPVTAGNVGNEVTFAHITKSQVLPGTYSASGVAGVCGYEFFEWKKLFMASAGDIVTFRSDNTPERDYNAFPGHSCGLPRVYFTISRPGSNVQPGKPVPAFCADRTVVNPYLRAECPQ
jgi:hypothetical protein